MSSLLPLLHVSDNLTKFQVKAIFYPNADGTRLARIQTFSGLPRFTPDGYETEQKKEDAFEREKAEKDETSKADVIRATRRAKRNSFDIIMCNPDLDAFATLTYSPQAVENKAEYADCYPFLKTWLSNGVQRRGLKYVCVPELTKAGDVHFHLLCNSSALKLDKAFNPNTGHPIRHNGDLVYNITNWHAGFSTAQIIRTRPGDVNGREACAKYIYKYMGKNFGAKVGGRYVLTGGDL